MSGNILPNGFCSECPHPWHTAVCYAAVTDKPFCMCGDIVVPVIEAVPTATIPYDFYHQKKHDNGKVRMDLLPMDALMEIARVFTFGCTPKEMGGAGYAEDSWKTVPDARKRYLAAQLRHIADTAKGESVDPESHLFHEAHAAWNAIAVLWLKMHENDNNKY